MNTTISNTNDITSSISSTGSSSSSSSVHRRLAQLVNGNMETDTVTTSGSIRFNYMNPSSWIGLTSTGASPGNILIKYSDNNWDHPNNGGGGQNFLGLQGVGNYIQQTVTVPTYTNFSIVFDVSSRAGGTFQPPNLQLFCNADGNASTIIITSILL